MHEFVGRNARPEDLALCESLIFERALYGAEDLTSWREMVRAALSNGGGFGAIFTDANDRDRLVGMGLALFVSDAIEAELYHLKRPAMYRALARDFTSGQPVFLREEEVSASNAREGVNLATTFGVEPSFGTDELLQLFFTMQSKFEEMTAGFKLRSWICENFDPGPSAILAAFGHLQKQYDEERLRLAEIDGSWSPLVRTFRLSDVIERPNDSVTGMFLKYKHPKLRLRRDEQRVLSLALEGLTDQDIALALGVSAALVKKHLQTTYEKAAACGVVAATRLGDNGARGSESRRHVLKYLSEHPEELRPYDWSAVS